MRKIALDADPGVADALALAFALFDPDVEIVAVTSVGGWVDSRTSARNLQSLVAFLDPPRLPRIGVENAVEDERNRNRLKRNVCSTSCDGSSTNFNDIGGFTFPVVERCSPRSAATILRDAVRAHPRETSILALGPLTNVARAFRRDPELPFLLNRLVVAGGGAPFNNPTNATEFNIVYDRQAARVVFQAPCAKTFVPADAAADLVFSFDDLRTFDSRGDVVGEFLRRLLLDILRVRRRTQGSEVVCLHELAAYFALVDPNLFSTIEAYSVDEIYGGAAYFANNAPNRTPANRRPDVEIVRRIDADAVRQKIVDGFQRIVAQTRSRFSR